MTWSKLGFNLPYDSTDLTQAKADLDYLYSQGIRKVRLSQPSCAYPTPTLNAGYTAGQALSVYALAKGYTEVLWGGTVWSTELNKTFWADYKSFVQNTLAPWAAGLNDSRFVLMLGNEEELHNSVGIVSLTAAGTTATMTVYNVQDSFPDGDTVTIAGAADAKYDGTYVVTKVSPYVYTYTIAAGATSPDLNGSPTGATIKAQDIDTDTIFADINSLANTIHGTYPSLKLGYALAAYNSAIAKWAAISPIYLDKLGFNEYNGYNPNLTFKTSVNSLYGLFGAKAIITEWSTGGGYTDAVNNNNGDPEMEWSLNLGQRLSILKGANLSSNYFFCYRDNLFGLSPNVFGIRKTDNTFRLAWRWVMELITRIPDLYPRKAVNSLIFNGDFEYAPPFVAATNTVSRWIDGTAAGSKDKNAYGWGTTGCTGTVAAQYDNNIFHSGKNSLKLSTLATGSQVTVSTVASTSATGIRSQAILLKQGVSYTLSGWIKTKVNSGAATTGTRMMINLIKADGTFSASKFAATSITTTTDWTYYTVTFTPSGDQAWAYVVCDVRGQDGTGTLIMDAWFDDITFTTTTPTVRKNSNLAPTYALNFDAATDTPRVEVTNNAALNNLTAVTVECWVKFNRTKNFAWRIMDKLSSGNSGYKMQGNTGTSQVNPTVGNGTTTVGVTVTLPYGVWSHVAISWDGAKVYVFLNGVLVNAGGTVLAGGNTGDDGNPLYIGNSSLLARAPGALIQEFRISNIARYTANFIPQTTPFTSDVNTIFLAHLDEGTGSPKDSGPNNLTLTLAGTTNPIWSQGYLMKPSTTKRNTAVNRTKI